MTIDPDDVDPVGDRTWNDARVRTIFAGILIGLSIAAISQTLVTTALPTMVGELGGFDKLSWVISAYLLTSAIVVPFAGKLSDLFGSTRLFQLAIVVFAAGSLLAGLSNSMVLLIVARGIQGVGGGAIMTVAFTLVAHIVPARERGRYQGYITSLFAVTSIAGPLVGGFFVDHLTWRWAFYLNVALSAVAIVVVRRNLPPDSSRPSKGVDQLGAALLVVTLVSVMLVAVWGGQQYAWSSPVIGALAIVAVVGAVAFIRCERVAAEPIVPLELFRHRVVRVATILGFLTGVTMFGVIVYTPTYLQVSLGVSATTSGLLLIPLMSSILIGSTFGGRAMSRTGRYKSLAVAGSAVLAVGAGLLATTGVGTALYLPSAYVGLVGLGLGLTLPVTLVAVQHVVSKEQLGAATSTNQFARKMGSTLGVAALGGIFSGRVSSRLVGGSNPLPAGTTPDSVLESPAAIDQLPVATADAVRSAVADGSSLVFAVAFVIAVIALVVSVRLPDDRLDDDDLETAGDRTRTAVDQ
ncbi:MAG TPA: MDR family MFS transporter [Ilumatobacteraceae bacterium]|nr:MDR family MFS transporter [Ilumatobacteraceae bacterium]